MLSLEMSRWMICASCKSATACTSFFDSDNRPRKSSFTVDNNDDGEDKDDDESDDEKVHQLVL